jgi:hypothetical protein
LSSLSTVSRDFQSRQPHAQTSLQDWWTCMPWNTGVEENRKENITSEKCALKAKARETVGKSERLFTLLLTTFSARQSDIDSFLHLLCFEYSLLSLRLELERNSSCHRKSKITEVRDQDGNQKTFERKEKVN